jgi:beta-alanine--pyruvate transaminase
VPPAGYLERLRAICDRHGILLIFDEVITGFGRTGQAFAAQTFGVKPDMITFAKGVTSGVVPLGGVLVDHRIHAAFMQGPDHAIEFFHGYTYSGHPLAAAAGVAALDVYRDEQLFARARTLAPALEAAVHGLKGYPHVVDVRNYGLVAAVELQPRPHAPSARAMDVFRHCFAEGVLVRVTGETIALTPPLVVSESEIGRIVETLGRALHAVV